MYVDNRKKEYLMQYRRAVQHEEELVRQLEEVRQQYMLRSQQLDGMPRTGGASDLSDYAARYDELLTALCDAASRTLELRKDITQRIESMSNELEKTILHMHYISGFKFEYIASQIGYTLRWTIYLHGVALQHLEL